MPVLRLAASCAFWNLSKTEIVDVCKLGGVAVPAASSLFDVLSNAVSNCLATGEEETLKILSQRLADNEAVNSFTEAILEVDEAAEVLEKSDQESLADEQKQARSRLEQRQTYRDEYTEKMKLFRLAREKKSKKGKKEMTKGSLPTVISQRDAKKFIPPGTHIWRGLTKGSWQGHCEPFARVYESWANSSEPEAMRRIIKKLWEQYLMVSGKDWSHCPWTFDEVAVVVPE